MIAHDQKRPATNATITAIKPPKLSDQLRAVQGNHGAGRAVSSQDIYVYNQSSKHLAVTRSSGFSTDHPPYHDYVHERVLIVVAWRVGDDVVPNWGHLRSTLTDEEKVFFDEARKAYDNEPSYGVYAEPRELLMYYHIDVSDIEYLPYGIAVDRFDLDINLVSSANIAGRNRSRVTIDLNPETDGVYIDKAATQTLLYSVDSREDVEPIVVFTQLGKPKPLYPHYDITRLPGLYVINTGSLTSIPGEKEEAFKFIPKDQFSKNGIFRSYKEYRDSLQTFVRTLGKAEQDAIIKKMSGILDEIPPDVNMTANRLLEFMDHKALGVLSFKDFCEAVNEYLKRVNEMKKSAT